MRNGKLGYRSDIDGLRAIAVLAVIANHLPEAFLPSGFLGVDVFFVISGFVVSATLLNRGHATFAGFYSNFLSRRVKRLMPALIVCVAITGTIVLLIDPFPQISILTGVSALFGVANITLFHFALDYFAPSTKFNAFTHMWSLGVEEQFYVVFPLLVWLTVSGTARRSSAALSASIALLSLVSFLFFLRLYHVNQVAAYYLVPTRFWELGAGVLVLQATKRITSTRVHRIVEIASPCTLIALILCFFAPQAYATVSTPVAVGLTALLLLNARQNIASRVLSLPPAVYVGKISYSLYLWHWPVVALAPLLLKPGWRMSALYVVTMGTAAIISYHRIERPLREKTWSTSKALDIAMGFACSFMLATCAYFGLHAAEDSNAQLVAERYPVRALPILESGLPYETCEIRDQREITPQTFEQCTIPPKPGSGMPMIWAMGDSHAGHLQGMLYALHQSQGFGVHLIATPGHFFPSGGEREFPTRQELFNKVLERLQPGDIILISRFYLTRDIPTEPHWDMPLWTDNVAHLAKALENRDVILVVSGPSPIFNFTDLRECDLAQRKNCAVARSELAAAIDPVMKRLDVLQRENAHLRVFDLFAQVCPPSEEFCFPDDGTRFLYYDRDHFNSLGSKRLAEPFMNFLQTSGLLRGSGGTGTAVAASKPG